MSLREQIPQDLKDALRSKNSLELSVLRMLQAAIKNKEIDLKSKCYPYSYKVTNRMFIH